MVLRRKVLRRKAARAATVLGLVLALAGCEEEPQSRIQPVQITRESRSVVSEAPDPLIVQPHLRRRELTDEDRAARQREIEAAARAGGGSGGGGGFGSHPDDWVGRPAEAPSQRELEAFRRQLEREMSARVDSEDDPCDQYRDVAAAGAAAAHRPGDPSAAIPGRAEMQRLCEGLPSEFRPCLEPTYMREHIDECQAALARMGARGQRRSDRAQGEWDEVRRGVHPLQTGGRPHRPGHHDDDDDDRDDRP